MPAAAQPAKLQVDIAAGTGLGEALRQVAVQGQLNLVAPSALLAGRVTGRIQGALAARDAIERLLAGTGLAARLAGGDLIIGQSGPQARGSAADTDILVTGSRIRGAAPVGAPLIVLDRQDIERSGYATTQQLLQALPQNFGGSPNESNIGISARNGAGGNLAYGATIDLRGLGSSSTLVLLDGNRPPLGGLSGAFADLSLIPSSVIERIEVLADGASAIYGSDAVAGVVNIRFRNRFEGLETRLRAGTADGDFEDLQVSQLAGFGWSSGRAVLGYEYQQRGRLVAAKRAFATEDLRRFGGADYRTDFSSPATIIAANGAIFGVPAGQDGRSLEPGDLIAGAANRSDARLGSDLLPRQRTHSAYVGIEQEMGESMVASAQLLAARRAFVTRTLPSQQLEFAVTPANPFYVDPIGTGEPVSVRYDFRPELGPETTRGAVTSIAGVVGARRRLGRWSADLRLGYGHQLQHIRTENLVNQARLAAALADKDPATAFNPFGVGGSNLRSTLDAIRGSRRDRIRYESWTGALRADGPLLDLPGGTVQLALGIEHRREGLSYRVLRDTRTVDGPVLDPPLGFPGPRDVTAGYAEILVPLIGAQNAVPGIDRLAVSAAVRTERYSDVGNTTNPKLGIDWVPLKGVTLRGSYGRSFRAPTFDELIGSRVSLYQPAPLPDPASPTGFTTVLALFGYSDDIGPERAETWTIGVDVEPGFAPGLRASATLFNIGYRGRIATATQDIFNFLPNRAVFGGLITDNPDPALVASYYAAPTFNNPLGIPATAIRAILDGRVLNLSSLDLRGIDATLSYAHELGSGRLTGQLAGSYLLHARRRLTADAPAADIVGTLGNPVAFRGRGQLGWSDDRWDISSAINYVDGYTVQNGSTRQSVSSWTTIDARIGYRLAKSTQLALTASNLFDRDPPFVENITVNSAIGYDPDKASAIGRVIAAQLIVDW